ncbi:MAG: aminodeoxychorismate synthase component I, partial [Aeromonas sp.]
PLAALPWAMLLASAGSDAGSADNAIDIMVADPLASLCTFGDVTELHDYRPASRTPACIPTASTQDPLAQLATVQAQLLGDITPGNYQTPCGHDVPFIGGALGLWGYDLGRCFETLPTQARADSALPDMAVGIYDWALVRLHATGKVYLLHWGDAAGWQARHAWLQQQWQRAAQSKQRAEAAPFHLTGPWQQDMRHSDYQAHFAAIQAHLRAGDCYQINLTQRFHAKYQGDAWAAFTVLSRANRAPFSAFLRLPQGAVLSLSPERFIKLGAPDNPQRIETKPIKGTRPRSPNPQEDARLARELALAEKDRAENLMIVDLLRNDIGRVSQLGSVTVPHLFAIESFPAVHHLVSTIEGQLASGYRAVDLLRACFPGGSITGAPKIRAMQIIESLEPVRRSAYCGSIGYISQQGRMDTNIAIRTLIAQPDDAVKGSTAQGSLYCWAGGGIVADSECAAEYQETFDKLSKILPVLAAMTA